MIKIKDCRYGPMMYLANDKWTGRSFDLYGEAYQQQISVMERFIKPHHVVVDAGANIGAMTIPFAKKAKQVIAVEPQRFLCYILGGNVALNSLYNVETHNCSLAEQGANLTWCPSPKLINDDGVPFYDDELQHYGGVYVTDEPRFETDDPIITMSIDHWHLKQCDFIKLDIEGAELKALKGGIRTIEKFKPVMFIESMPLTFPKLVAAITDLGYVYRSCRMRFFNPNNFFNNQVDELREAHDPNTPMMSSDIICYHKDHESEMDSIYFKAVKELL